MINKTNRVTNSFWEREDSYLYRLFLESSMSFLHWVEFKLLIFFWFYDGILETPCHALHQPNQQLQNESGDPPPKTFSGHKALCPWSLFNIELSFLHSLVLSCKYEWFPQSTSDKLVFTIDSISVESKGERNGCVMELFHTVVGRHLVL